MDFDVVTTETIIGKRIIATLGIITANGVDNTGPVYAVNAALEEIQKKLHKIYEPHTGGNIAVVAVKHSVVYNPELDYYEAVVMGTVVLWV